MNTTHAHDSTENLMNINPDQIMKKWTDWLKQIREQFSQLLHLREIYEEVGKMIETNPDLQRPNSFYDWLHETYTTTVAIGVRRLVYSRRGSGISLIGLLKEIEEMPHLLSRQRYIGLYGISNKSIANQHYDKLIGVGMNSPNFDIINKDKLSLIKATKEIKTYADNHIAHLVTEPPENLATWKSLNASLAITGQLLQRYLSLLKAEAWPDLKPTIQNHWKAIFEVSWISEKS